MINYPDWLNKNEKGSSFIFSSLVWSFNRSSSFSPPSVVVLDPLVFFFVFFSLCLQVWIMQCIKIAWLSLLSCCSFFIQKRSRRKKESHTSSPQQKVERREEERQSCQCMSPVVEKVRKKRIQIFYKDMSEGKRKWDIKTIEWKKRRISVNTDTPPSLCLSVTSFPSLWIANHFHSSLIPLSCQRTSCV